MQPNPHNHQNNQEGPERPKNTNREKPRGILGGNAELKRLKENIKRPETIDDGSAEKIAALDIEKSLYLWEPEKLDKKDFEEQKEGFELMEIVLPGLYAKLRMLHVDEEHIKKIGTTPLPQEILKKLNRTEIRTLGKISEFSRDPNHPVTKEIQKLLNELENLKIYETSKEVVGMETEKPTEKPKEEKGIMDTVKEQAKKVTDYVKENPKKTALFVVGGIGAYMLIKKLLKDEKSESSGESGQEDENVIWKWTKRALITAGVLVGAGSILEFHGVKKWFEKMGIDIDENRFTAALTYLGVQKFDLKKFMEVLLEGNKEHEKYKEISRKISVATGKNISPETIALIGGRTFNEFDSWGESAKEWFSEKVNGLIKSLTPTILESGLNFAGKPEEEYFAEIDAIREYIDNNEEKTDRMEEKKEITDRTSVLQVLAKLSETPLQPGEGVIKENPEYEKVKKELDPVIAQMPEGQKKETIGQILNNILPFIVPQTEFNQKIRLLKEKDIDTEEAEEIYGRMQTTLARLIEATKNHQKFTDEEYEEIAVEFIEANMDFDEEYKEIEDELLYRHGGQQLSYLIFGQGMMYTRRLLKGTEFERNFKLRIAKNVALAPFEKAAKGIGRLRGKDAEYSIKKAEEMMLDAENFFKGKGVTDQEIKIMKKRGMTDAINKKINPSQVDSQEIKRWTEILEAGSAIGDYNKAKLGIENNKKSLEALQKSPNPDSKKVQALEDAIKKGEASLGDLEVKAAGRRIKILDSNMERLAQAKGKFSESSWEDFRRMEKEIGQHRETIWREIEKNSNRLADIKKGKIPGTPAEIKALESKLNELLHDYTAEQKMLFGHFNTMATKFQKWKARNASRFSPEIAERYYRDGLTRFRAQMHGAHKDAIRQNKIDKEMNKPGFVGKWGRRFIIPALFITGTALSTDEQTSIGKAAGQMGVDMMPVTSWLSDFYSVFSGEEFVTKRKLDWSDRGLRILFGIAGVATDVATVASFGTLGAPLRGAMAAARGGKALSKGAKAAKMVERAEAGKNAKIMRLPAGMEKVGKYAGRVAALGALTQVGYQIFATEEEVPMSAETEQVLNDMENLPPETITPGKPPPETQN